MKPMHTCRHICSDTLYLYTGPDDLPSFAEVCRGADRRSDTTEEPPFIALLRLLETLHANRACYLLMLSAQHDVLQSVMPRRMR